MLIGMDLIAVISDLYHLPKLLSKYLNDEPYDDDSLYALIQIFSIALFLPLS